MKILFVHLLNNYTGSPRILRSIIEVCNKNNKVSLITSKTDGILSNIENISTYDNGYRWSNNRIKLNFFFIYSQIKIFLFVIFHKFDLIYINTVLPFGASLAARIKRKKIIYHVHEIYINPGFVKRLYYKIMLKTANKIICVSKYVQDNLPRTNIHCKTVYNSIEMHDFTNINLDEYLLKKFNSRIIFMPTSLKDYKGVDRFVELARHMPEYNFHLLCSVSIDDMNNYFSDTKLPDNLVLEGKKPDIFNDYCESAITMNLTLYDKCIETFGLTIVEGFDTFTPAIAPNYGGPKEIINNGKDGFLIDPYDIDSIEESIKRILLNFDTYKNYAINAKKRAQFFNKDLFISNIKEVVLSMENDK